MGGDPGRGVRAEAGVEPGLQIFESVAGADGVRGEPRTVVPDTDEEATVHRRRLHADTTAAPAGRDRVLDAVLDERLHGQRRGPPPVHLPTESDAVDAAGR